MSENKIVPVLLFSNTSFTKDMKFSTITSSVRFIKDIKRFDDHFFVKENFLMYFHRNNNLKYFITFCISVFCNLSAVKTSKV